MKSYLPMGILLILTGLNFSCAVKTIPYRTFSSLREQNIKGTVSIIEQRRYSVDHVGNVTTEDTCCVVRSEFNKKGLNFKRETQNNKGVLNTKELYTFYSNGLIKTIKQLNKDGKVAVYEAFRLDSAGNYVGGTSFENGKLNRHFKVLEQNAFGTWSKLEWYTPEGVLIQTQVSTFDGNKLLKQVWINADGKTARNLIAEFNENGDHLGYTILAQVPGKDSISTRTSRYKYDAYDQFGNWIQRSVLDKDGKVTKVIKRSFTYR